MEADSTVHIWMMGLEQRHFRGGWQGQIYGIFGSKHSTGLDEGRDHDY